MPEPLGAMERLPKWLLCVPLVTQWFWLGARYRSLTLPSVVNAGIENGGLAGERKFPALERLQAALPEIMARTVCVEPGHALSLRDQLGAGDRVIAKPDIGWCGYGVRLVRSDAELAAYARAYPPEARFLLQAYVEAPHEAGLFYVREAGVESGRLVSVTLRHAPHVVGDGVRDAATLITANPRTRPHLALYREAGGSAALAHVPATGEVCQLTTIASLRAGARYENATARLATAALSAAVERAAAALNDFHFGRFDVRFENEATLAAGHFRIIEVNGAGSEAIEFWDPRLGLRDAFAGVFAKQRRLFALGDALRRRGARPVGVVALSRAWLRQQALVRRYPNSN